MVATPPVIRPSLPVFQYHISQYWRAGTFIVYTHINTCTHVTSAYTYLFFLGAGVCFLIGWPYLHQAGGVVGAREVKVHLDGAPTPSGSDVIFVQVIVEKQIVLDAQKINYISVGQCGGVSVSVCSVWVCECVSVSAWVCVWVCECVCECECECVQCVSVSVCECVCAVCECECVWVWVCEYECVWVCECECVCVCECVVHVCMWKWVECVLQSGSCLCTRVWDLFSIKLCNTTS